MKKATILLLVIWAGAATAQTDELPRNYKPFPALDGKSDREWAAMPHFIAEAHTKVTTKVGEEEITHKVGIIISFLREWNIRGGLSDESQRNEILWYWSPPHFADAGGRGIRLNKEGGILRPVNTGWEPPPWAPKTKGKVQGRWIYKFKLSKDRIEMFFDDGKIMKRTDTHLHLFDGRKLEICKFAKSGEERCYFSLEMD